jgi:hypothetical protein
MATFATNRAKRRPWRARVKTIHGETFLGYFETKEEAILIEEAYKAAHVDDTEIETDNTNG